MGLSREEDIRAQLYVIWDFLDFLEEKYPDEYDEAYEEYKIKRNKNEF